eukprot:gnl/Dysnectes_brevis/4464_a6012_391.p1 GENE.gnl/Dysnectes_brevis/4464_a6012_391~~gnl/Dysnectes_brevis/4464_a6012_391.p1  ORF type:complete len:664 (-),score=106.38 gnl/Dysnectes_brevis/4464_a6012_391:64-2055(-)
MDSESPSHTMMPRLSASPPIPDRDISTHIEPPTHLHSRRNVTRPPPLILESTPQTPPGSHTTLIPHHSVDEDHSVDDHEDDRLHAIEQDNITLRSLLTGRVSQLEHRLADATASRIQREAENEALRAQLSQNKQLGFGQFPRGGTNGISSAGSRDHAQSVHHPLESVDQDKITDDLIKILESERADLLKEIAIGKTAEQERLRLAASIQAYREDHLVLRRERAAIRAEIVRIESKYANGDDIGRDIEILLSIFGPMSLDDFEGDADGEGHIDRISAYEGHIRDLEALITEHALAKEDFQSRISTFETRVLDMDSQIDSLDVQLQERDNTISGQIDRITKLEADNTQLVKELNLVSVSRTAVVEDPTPDVDQLQMLTQECNRAVSQLEQSNATIRTLEQRLEESQTVIREKSNEVSRRISQISELESSHETLVQNLRIKIDQFEHDNSELASDLDATRLRLVDTSSKLSTAHDHLVVISRKLDESSVLGLISRPRVQRSASSSLLIDKVSSLVAHTEQMAQELATSSSSTPSSTPQTPTQQEQQPQRLEIQELLPPPAQTPSVVSRPVQSTVPPSPRIPEGVGSTPRSVHLSSLSILKDRAEAAENRCASLSDALRRAASDMTQMRADYLQLKQLKDSLANKAFLHTVGVRYSGSPVRSTSGKL